jgi:hypothetical protein
MEELLEHKLQGESFEAMTAVEPAGRGKGSLLSNSMCGAIQFLSDSITEYAVTGDQVQELGDSDIDL